MFFFVEYLSAKLIKFTNLSFFLEIELFNYCQMFATVVTALEHQKLKSAHNALQQKVEQMEEKFTQKIQEKENEIAQAKRANERMQKKMDEAMERIERLNELMESQMIHFYEQQQQRLDNDGTFIAGIDENSLQIQNGITQHTMEGNQHLLFAQKINECVIVEQEKVRKLGGEEENTRIKEELEEEEKEVNGEEEEEEKELNGEEEEEWEEEEKEDNNGREEEEEEGEAVKDEGIMAEEQWNDGMENGTGPTLGTPFQYANKPKTITQKYSLAAKLNGRAKRMWYKCAHCPEAFRWLSALIRHERTHTGEKPFKCDQCGKDFARANTLNIHQRIHTGEKPYQCHLCDARFTQDGQLKTHILIHTGEKPYKCTYCPQKFTRAGNLTTHLRRHTEKKPKPFMCSHCGKQFAQSSDLQIHLLTHFRKRKANGQLSNRMNELVPQKIVLF